MKHGGGSIMLCFTLGLLLFLRLFIQSLTFGGWPPDLVTVVPNSFKMNPCHFSYVPTLLSTPLFFLLVPQLVLHFYFSFVCSEKTYNPYVSVTLTVFH